MYAYHSKLFELDAGHHHFTFEINREGMLGLSEVRFQDTRLRVDNGALIGKRDPEAPEWRYVKR